MWSISKSGHVDKLVVFMEIDSLPVPVGVLSSSGDGRLRRAVFQYGKSWLENRERQAISPVGLPLIAKPQGSIYEAHIPFYDAVPDGWGKSVIRHAFPEHDFAISDFLAITGSDRSGNLSFGPSPSMPPEQWLPKYQQFGSIPSGAEDLEELLDAAEKSESGDANQHHFNLLFRSSADQGGARPKTTIKSGGRHYIAKFPALDDRFDDPKVEAVCLSLARACGIETPNHYLIRVKNKSVLMIERFDRDEDDNKLGFSSALSLVQAEPSTYYTDISYQEIALRARHAGVAPCEEDLFRRALFNSAIHNTDDHLKNHGFLLVNGKWKLSPVYDLSVHRPNRLVLAPAKGISPEADPSITFTAYKKFGITAARAEEIYNDIIEAAKFVPDLFEKYELTKVDRDILSQTWGFLFNPRALEQGIDHSPHQ